MKEGFLGDYLAQHGYVVLSTDAPMWGERGQKEGARRNMYDIIAGNMMMYGVDLSAYMTYDDLAGTGCWHLEGALAGGNTAGYWT